MALISKVTINLSLSLKIPDDVLSGGQITVESIALGNRTPVDPLISKGCEASLDAYYSSKGKKASVKRKRKEYPLELEQLLALFKRTGNKDNALDDWNKLKEEFSENQEYIYKSAEAYVKKESNFQMSASNWIEQRLRQRRFPKRSIYDSRSDDRNNNRMANLVISSIIQPHNIIIKKD